MTGIYKIQSKTKPERFYIGSAVDIKHRWWGHKSDLLKDEHHSSKLQRHVNKYGFDDLDFSVEEECIKDDLLKEESVDRIRKGIQSIKRY